MMLRAVCVLLLALLALPAIAQEPATYTVNEYVEAHRPVIAQRKLTGAEQAEAKRLIAEIKKQEKPAHALMDQLAPLAAAGDKDAMKAMVSGYDRAEGVLPPALDEPFHRGSWEPNYKLRGLWSMQLWNAGDRSKETSKGLSHCLTMEKYPNRRCGFTGSVQGGNASAAADAFEKHFKGKGGAPQNATFTEYPLVDGAERDKKRFDGFIAQMQSGTTYVADDYTWAEIYARRQGPDVLAVYNSATRAFVDRRVASERNAVAYAQQDRQAKAAEWDKLVAKAKDAKSRGTQLSDADQDRWVKLSHELGGTYLLPYASQTVIFEKTVIDSLCAADSGKVCQRQRELFEARAEDRRRELAAIDAPIRTPALPGDVTVRTYDQNGNYLGSTSMRPWQADIVGAN